VKKSEQQEMMDRILKEPRSKVGKEPAAPREPAKVDADEGELDLDADLDSLLKNEL
jgi:hypothetical protein